MPSITLHNELSAEANAEVDLKPTACIPIVVRSTPASVKHRNAHQGCTWTGALFSLSLFVSIASLRLYYTEAAVRIGKLDEDYARLE